MIYSNRSSICHSKTGARSPKKFQDIKFSLMNFFFITVYWVRGIFFVKQVLRQVIFVFCCNSIFAPRAFPLLISPSKLTSEKSRERGCCNRSFLMLIINIKEQPRVVAIIKLIKETAIDASTCLFFSYNKSYIKTCQLLNNHSNITRVTSDKNMD